MTPAPTLKPICTLKVELGPMIEMGVGRAGHRRIFPIEMGDPRYQWVNKTIFIGTGMRKASAVEVAMFAVE